MNNNPDYNSTDTYKLVINSEYVKELEKRTHILERIYYLQKKLKEAEAELEKFDNRKSN